MMASWQRLFCRILLVASIATVYSTRVQAAEDFYRSKTISIISSTGTYEMYARMFAKYMPKYIPGQPNIIVKVMTGASGLKATNYIANVAPRDGTEITAVQSHIPTTPLFSPQGTQYDPRTLSWIGSATKEHFISYVWHTSPVQTMEDARVREIVVGGQAIGSMSIDIALLANAMMGTKLKIVTGYKGAADNRLAVERGELQGAMGAPLVSTIAQVPEWFSEKRITVIAQTGETRHRLLPDVPSMFDYVLTEGDKTALRLYLSRLETGKPYFGPPGIPKDRLAILRKAFASALADPEFQAEVSGIRLELDEPMTGEQVEELVHRMNQTPPSATQRINDIFAAFMQK